MRLAVLILALAVFVGWSFWLVHDDGLGGLFALIQDNDWGAQVFVDLAIALTVVFGFMRGDAKARGLPFVPYLIAMPFCGSMSVLAYLIHRELRASR